MNIYADNISKTASLLQLTQEYIADKMGVSRGFVSQWMTGYRPVPAERALDLGAILKLKAAEVSEGYATVERMIVDELMPNDLRQKIEGAANSNRRTINEEITARLEASFDPKLTGEPPHIDKTVRILEDLLKYAERLQVDLHEKDDIIKAQKEVISRKK